MWRIGIHCLNALGGRGIESLYVIGMDELLRLVDQREEAIARVSGHVADSLMNMDTIRAFAAEDREAAEHRKRVADQRRKSMRSWDYANLRIDALVAPMTVLTNVPCRLPGGSRYPGSHCSRAAGSKEQARSSRSVPDLRSGTAGQARNA